MNIHDITLRIENPALLLSSDIPVLYELSKKYPYSQLISLLYLKALAKDQSLDLEDALTKHAYKITDRVRLYEILNENQKETSIIQELHTFDSNFSPNSENKEFTNPILDTENQKDTSEKIDDSNIFISPTEGNEDTTNVIIEKNEEAQRNNEKELDLSVISNADVEG